MTRRALACVALLALAAGIACSARADGPPPLEEDRTACAHCGMLVSERMFAAAYRTARGESKVFDDIGCLLSAARAEGDATAREFWFHDARTRAWIEGRRAVFMRAPGLKTPMAGGILAYAEAAAAGDAAAEHGGRVIGTLEQLLADTTKAGGS